MASTISYKSCMIKTLKSEIFRIQQGHVLYTILNIRTVKGQPWKRIIKCIIPWSKKTPRKNNCILVIADIYRIERIFKSIPHLLYNLNRYFIQPDNVNKLVIVKKKKLIIYRSQLPMRGHWTYGTLYLHFFNSDMNFFIPINVFIKNKIQTQNTIVTNS